MNSFSEYCRDRPLRYLHATDIRSLALTSTQFYLYFYNKFLKYKWVESDDTSIKLKPPTNTRYIERLRWMSCPILKNEALLSHSEVCARTSTFPCPKDQSQVVLIVDSNSLSNTKYYKNAIADMFIKFDADKIVTLHYYDKVNARLNEFNADYDPTFIKIKITTNFFTLRMMITNTTSIFQPTFQQR